MSDQFVLIGLVVVSYLLAGSVKGVIGMGLPTVAIAILASVMSPAKAAAILIAPSLFTNVWQMLVGPYLGALVRRLGPMLGGIWIGAWAGAGVLTGGNSKQAALGLGLVLIAYAALGLSKIDSLCRAALKSGPGRWLASRPVWSWPRPAFSSFPPCPT